MMGGTGRLQVSGGLIAASQAALRAGERGALWREVCAAALDEHVVGAAMFVAGGGGDLRYEARAGIGAPDGAGAAASGLVERAFHGGRACVGLVDVPGLGEAAAAAMPVGGHGVLLLLATEAAYFDDEVMALAAGLAENIAFAVARLELAAERDRINRMVSAISASNEAILRAETRDKLFQLVCEAAVQGGNFTLTTVVLAQKGTNELYLVAIAGTGVKAVMEFVETRVQMTAREIDQSGMTGTAFRTRRPCISNDALGEGSSPQFHEMHQVMGSRSVAALPLISRDQAVGVMLFASAERNTFTPEFVVLLERLAANVSFALENFDRAQEKELAEERIRYLATHDSLTDLPNRVMFDQLLGFSIRTARRFDRKCAVLFIDLDRFKIINDSLGHEAGDALLVEVARRLRGCVRANDVVARLGGDEFMLLLNEIAEIQQAAAIARELVAVLSKPLSLAGHECRITASIGVAMFPDDGESEQSLMKNADIAMYLAKSEGKNTVRFFSNEIKAPSVDRLKMEAGLRHALERDEFCLHYQPKLSVVTGQVTGVEALLRWMHPEMGLLLPIRFISVAEETGLIVPIGGWVMKTACLQNMAWQRAGYGPVTMAVNVSPRQFADETLLRDLDEALAVSGMEPRLLQIEITESMIMLNVERAIKILDVVQARGVRIAIDDFGTGYSSMSVMKQFPIDTIKIDRSFVRGLPEDPQDKGIAQAIISMSKALGLTVVAEGVENLEQEAFLRGQACDEVQGFLFSEPVPAEQIAVLLGSAPRLASRKRGRLLKAMN